MPVIKSAIKRAKTNVKANKRNTAQVSKMRDAIKKFMKSSKNDENVYRDAISAVDHAKSKGLIKANKADREKSHMSAKFNK
ncbi:30S ribosomal protein S20 [Philodulcilactobacillus myokoensis]|uniref:Small ribosomal subunit protein bS20 n=1 Tax=Philodulcilactobacillus myokoensis TaxID=2929573 RepID=A0A9W6ESZ9_9LACO|nr:30S ribosomal protein S20 [Philodulcilactobacillus myokoensis]GLB46987.1 30S ribosomal protein S20 [Philodulcilactobacillus myokoensis]